MKRTAGALALSLLILLTSSVSAQAVKLPKFKLPQVYEAKLHVAGGVTITSTRNTLDNCAPGQAWTMTETADLVINDTVKVQRIGNLVSSSFARDPGGVQQRSRLSNYQSTNYCPPDAPAKLTKPECSNLGGTALANLNPDPRRNGMVSIGLTRRGGGKQDLTCIGPTLDSTPRGSAVTALQLPLMPILLPLNIKVKAFKRLDEGKRIISVVHIGGPCERAVVYPGARAEKAAEDSCEVEGVFNVMVKRLSD